jgi:hypothetical protein
MTKGSDLVYPVGTDAGDKVVEGTLAEDCRLFCAWKGGGPCLRDDCPRRDPSYRGWKLGV